MKSKKKSAIVLCYLFLLAIASYSQERCGAVEYQKKLQQQSLYIETENQFENWMRESVKRNQQILGTQRPFDTQRRKATYQIPVVIHVIHNGEPIGTGTNISEVQILSQLAVLNKDYNRLNTDASQTPAEFLPVAGSLDIEFVLAKQNPEGLHTDGIVRVKGSKSFWTLNDDYQLKSQSYWAAEDYLNIWVCNIVDQGYLGYAQFPQSTLLPGLENASANRLTDGVVIHYKAFGSKDDGAFDLDLNYQKGRTATHEVGHFFGLRHIWGDENNCTATDYVDDTPNQSTSTQNCPNHPRTSCNVVSMFQNFLDYTYDECMNIFTQGQIDRMKVILDNSPRRKSLLTSRGLLVPEPVPNDAGIRSIISPTTGDCSSSVFPQIEVRNYGNNHVSSIRIRVSKGGVNQFTEDFQVDLPYLASTVLTFSSSVSLSSVSENIGFQILQTNGGADGNSLNNTANVTVTSPPSVSIPFIQTFGGSAIPANWKVSNPDGLMTWQHNNALKAMMIEFYNYQDNLGAIDLLFTPQFNLTSAPVGLLLFDVAYSQYRGSNDGLKVVLLNNCDPDINKGTVIYSKSGKDLASAPPTDDRFVPVSSTHWRTESVNLFPYLGLPNLQLAFVGVNDYGNNLYIDNVRVITEDFENIAIKQILTPSPVTCENSIKPTLRIQNTGTEINSFKVKYTVGGSTSEVAYQRTIAPGAFLTLDDLPVINLTNGQNTIRFELTEPNNKPDLEPSDNSMEYKVIVNKTTEKIPFLESFESSWDGRWVSVNPFNTLTWKTYSFPDRNTVFFDGFNSLTSGEGWLVSPVYDFSKSVDDTLFFNLSYARSEVSRDSLEVLASIDCGKTFDVRLRSYSGLSLSPIFFDGQWIPSTTNDWQSKMIPLRNLNGKSNVRFAFVYKNYAGNNIYLDSVRVGPPFKVEGNFTITPNRARANEARITFNFPEQESAVVIEIIDSMGRRIRMEERTEVHFQTYFLPVQNVDPGMYFVRVTTSKGTKVSRLVIYR